MEEKFKHNKEDSDKILEKIECLIRARYPLIYLLSCEEMRVENTLRRIAFKREKKLIYWSITEGITGIKNESPDLKDPLKALELVINSKENAIFVFRDFHPYFKDPVVIRRLRDVNRVLKNSYKNLILLSPLLKIPSELEKEVVVVDYNLPTTDELNQIIDGILKSLPNNSKVETTLDKNQRERIVKAALGLTANEAESVFAKSLVKKGQFDIDVIISEKEQIIRKSGILEFYNANEKIDDVGGLGELKQWLRKRGLAFTMRAREFGLPQPKGILLIGIPGCGKSLTAKAVGNLWQLPLLRLDVGKIFAGLVGSSEENMRKAIKTAEAVAPSILWMDELEKGFSGTQSSTFSDAGTTARVFGSFITWLQEKNSPVFVVATANNVSLLPPELLRKGRFDEIFYVDLPDFEERMEIIRIHIEKRKRNSRDFDIGKIAQVTEGYSGSEIEEVIISALYDAFESNTDINTGLVINSADELIPLSQTMEKEIKAVREWAKTRARRASMDIVKDTEKNSRRLEI